MYKFINRWSRKLHRWGAVGFALPLLLVIISGLLLQVKKQSTWVQPATQKGDFDPALTMAEILEIAAADPKAEIESWDDIDRMDVRPGKGVIKVQSKNRFEIQIDPKTRKIMQSEYRRSDWIESLHDGSFFGDWAKLSIFLLNGIVLFILWISGAYLWYLPHLAKRKKNARRLAESDADRSNASG